MKYVIRRLSIKSVAKVSALLHCILFFLVGVIYGGVLIILSLVDFSSGSTTLVSGGISLALSILSLIGLPIGGLVYGFISGAVMSLLYNFVSDFVGGAEMVLVEKANSPAKPKVKGQDKLNA